MDSELKSRLEALKIDRGEESPTPRRGRLALVAVAGLALLGVAAFVLLQPRAVPVRTAIVAEAGSGSGGAAAVLNASGYVTARRQATVSSKVTGKVAEVLVEEGMKVEEGQILARLDDSQARLALGLAEARHAASSRSLAETDARRREAALREKRARELSTQGIVAPSEVDAVEAEVDALEARIEAQRAEERAAERAAALERQILEDMVIRAPFAGVAISKNAQPGEMISPMSAGGSFTRTGISTIVDMTSLEIEVDVNEAYIQRVAPGQPVTATLDAYPEAPFPAHVITTIPAADRQKATVTVRIGFEQLDDRILPDMGVKVAFLAEPDAAGDGGALTRRTVRVPRAAIRGEQGAQFVFVVDAESTLERRAVKVGPGGSDPADVVAGLSGGERVVVEGPAELAAGNRVAERENN